MALQKCGLNLDSTAKELQPHGSIAFPCAGYRSYHTTREEDRIPWHWHEEPEFIFIESGQIELKIPSRTFLLKEGEGVLLNGNVLHTGIGAPEGRLRSLVFSPALISGKEESVFEKNYMRPLLSCSAFTGLYISPVSNKAVADWFHRAFEALASDCYGYEFTVRENLSRICLFLHREFAPHCDIKSASLNLDNLRLKKMLDYIHKNYAENISLPDIAKEADISDRECLRCFQKIIQLSPIQYLLKYRMMQGAELLTRNPASSVSEVAAYCGFDSPSNFAKMFKRFYSCTPREYRNRNAK